MAVAAAIVGSAAIGAVTSGITASKAAKATEQGATAAADATLASTRLQIDEARRQFDASMGILAPLIMNQYGAQSAYAQLLGFDTFDPGDIQIPGGGPAAPSARTASAAGRPASPLAAPPGRGAPDGRLSPAAVADAGGFITPPNAIAPGPTPRVTAPRNFMAPPPPAPPRAGPPAARQPFVDPNVDPTRLGAPTAADSERGRFAFENVLAAPSPEADLAVRRVADAPLFAGIDADSAVRTARENTLAAPALEDDPYLQNVLSDAFVERAEDVRLAAPSLAEDERFAFTRDSAAVGPEFTASPGYEFALEEAERQIERFHSRGGGNVSPRALLEAKRRAVGMANQDYYNYVGARQRELGRQDAAAAAYQGRQATDIARGDVAIQTNQARQDEAVRNYLARQGIDISRLDAATASARSREATDIARGDAALDNYFARRAGDVTRQEAAIVGNQNLQQYDLARGDAAYQNYIAALSRAAGFGNPAGTAVNVGQGTAANVANAYGQQGAALASIYGQQGQDRANIALGAGANVNAALQGGIQNYLFMDALKQMSAGGG